MAVLDCSLAILGPIVFAVACGDASDPSATAASTEGTADGSGGTSQPESSSGATTNEATTTEAASSETDDPTAESDTSDASDSSDTTGASMGCVPGAPFQAVTPYAPLSDLDLAEPWVSPDGEVLLVTIHTGEFELGLGRSTRTTASDPFGDPEPIVFESWPDDAYQGSLDVETGDMHFVYGGEILRASATGDPTAFGVPAPADVVYPELTEWPEYPRAAAGGLYFSQRELNQRRSIYSFAPGDAASLALLYDAGDIFSFTVTPDGSTLYVTFQDELYDLRTYRGSRDDTTSAFGNMELLEQFDLDDGFAITGVTSDDCEVFGYVTDNSGNDRIWHAIRTE